MKKQILIDGAHPEEIRVALVDQNRLEEFDIEFVEKKQIKGNIYLGKVTRVEASLQAAFVEYGGNKQGFLPFSEIHYDYYQIPVEDKQRLLESLERDVDDDFGDDDEAQAEQASDSDKDDGEKVADPVDKEEAVDPAEEEASELRKKRSGTDLYKQYKIQEVIKRNQLILVQVIKEERGNKGASLSTYISIAGRYCVLMPNTSRHGGVSRRISDSKDRNRLRDILKGLEIPNNMGLIIRTAGVSRTKTEIKRDFKYLTELWDNIRQQTVSSEAPSLIYEEGDIIKRSLRDLYRNDVDSVVVEGEELFKSTKKFMRSMSPSHIKKIVEHEEGGPIFDAYSVQNQLEELYTNEASLESGGSIVITPTEALVSIDVNSGRATRGRNIEETALKTNLEAAEEVARQLRLRDLAGLVVIDFIDMRDGKNRRAVEKALKSALKQDRAKIQVGRISMFGLLEMSRQRLRASLAEMHNKTCNLCGGSGVVRSDESTALMILRAIETEAAKGNLPEIKLYTSHEAAFYVLNHKRQDIEQIAEDYEVKVTIESDSRMVGSDFRIAFPKNGKRRGNKKNNKHVKNNKKHQARDVDKNSQDKEEHKKDKNPKEKVKQEEEKAPKGKSPAGKKTKEKMATKKIDSPKKTKDDIVELATTKDEAADGRDNREDGEEASRLRGLWRKITTN